MARKERRSAANRARNSEPEEVPKQEQNNPVPVEEFDYERMGITARE